MGDSHAQMEIQKHPKHIACQKDMDVRLYIASWMALIADIVTGPLAKFCLWERTSSMLAGSAHFRFSFSWLSVLQIARLCCGTTAISQLLIKSMI